MIQIQKFREGIEEELWNVFFTAVRNVCINDYSEKQVKAWAPDTVDRNVWQNKMRTIKPFIAKINSSVVGYADLQEDGKIDHFFVHGNHQRKGVGNALMKTICCVGKNFNVLYSEVSMTAKPFYLCHGFEVQREQEFEIRGVKLKNNIMHKIQKKF